ncbi:hypothetical protein L1887_18108 [Cichorium endivia]|nr:hypothetical protein L1887_18108 [Cichorium endivia]
MSEWGPQNFPTSLVELRLNGENSGVVSFAVAHDVRNATTPSSSFLLPPSLVSLTLWRFTNVESFSEGVEVEKVNLINIHDEIAKLEQYGTYTGRRSI